MIGGGGFSGPVGAGAMATGLAGQVDLLGSLYAHGANPAARDATAVLQVDAPSTDPITSFPVAISVGGTLYLVVRSGNAANQYIQVYKALICSGSLQMGGAAVQDFVFAGAGVRFGQAAGDLWAMHGKPPTDQLAAIPDAAGGATVDTQARAAINAWLAGAREKGFIAP